MSDSPTSNAPNTGAPDEQRTGRYAPRLWPMPVAAGAAVAAALLAAGALYLVLRGLATPVAKPQGKTSIDALDVVKTTITVSAFVGAVLAGVYAYRKQRLAEGDATRADEIQLGARYTAAAEQLGHERPAVRLAGVYALSQLADEWLDQQQMCIDVLCSYLRLPYEPSPASPGYREGEREVRWTLLRVIRNHLRPNTTHASWQGRSFSFEGAVFDVGDLSGVHLSGGHVSFHKARFVEGRFLFSKARLNGASVWFTKASFEGAEVRFDDAQLVSGRLSFKAAEHSGGDVSFTDVRLSGTEVDWGPFEPL